MGNLSLLGIHNLVTLTASSYDGEGRVSSLNPSAGTAPFTGVTYGPFGPTAITYGSGDTDTFTYDNVGHIKYYQFNVGTGGQFYKGEVYWNSNGTVRHLLTTNSVTGVNTAVNGSQIQYAYDDLGRLSAAGDVVNSTMNQSFSYDVYGNNTKSGSPDSWIPPYSGYDPFTNRYKTGGSCGSGISYDADGNLLCDTFHTYTWDAEARLKSVDGKSLTRDAFGKVVESQTSGTIYEVLHTPLGDVWYSGQTPAWGNVKLPGGGSAIYTAGSIQRFNHPDWQGNARLSTNATAQTFNSSTEYAPFGEDYAHGTGSNCCVFSFDDSFEGMLSGMYDTPFRELHPVQGRWIQPDPAGLAAVDPSNPQTWNRYAYVANNPLSNVDPTGLLDDPSCKVNDIGCGGMDSGGMGGWDFGGGGGRGGAGIEACGVDIFCIQNGGIGPFGSPVAQIACKNGHCMTGSWAFSQYNVGGGYQVDWQAQRQAEIQGAVNAFLSQAAKNAAALNETLENFLKAQNIDITGSDQPFLKGGNWNFLIPPGAQIPTDCTSDQRCGDFPSLHFPEDHPGYVHLDTANVWRSFPLGAMAHGGVDVLLGWTFFATGIPRW